MLQRQSSPAPHLSDLTVAAQGAGGDERGFPAPSLLFQTKAPARTCGQRSGLWRVRHWPPPTFHPTPRLCCLPCPSSPFPSLSTPHLGLESSGRPAVGGLQTCFLGGTWSEVQQGFLGRETARLSIFAFTHTSFHEDCSPFLYFLIVCPHHPQRS